MKKFTLLSIFTTCALCFLSSLVSAQTIAQAVQNNDTATLNQLIISGANVDQADSNGTTPLMLACGLGDTLIAHILINNGSNVNLADNGLNTALSISAADAYIDLVNLLLAAGADPKQKVGTMRPYDMAIEAKTATLQNETPRNSSINQDAVISTLYTALGYK